VFGAVAGVTTGQDAVGRYRGLLGTGRSGKGALHYGVFVCCTELVGFGGEGVRHTSVYRRLGSSAGGLRTP
jgi:hypothetical protein